MKEKLLINLLIFLEVLLLTILTFNPFLRPLEKIFKFKVRQKSEKNLNQFKEKLYMKQSKIKDMLMYLLTMYIDKILYNLYTKERMFN